jgi:hypothetical protein
MGINVAKLYISLFLVISQEVVADINVLGFGVEDRVFGYAYGTRAITKQGHSSVTQTKIPQGGDHPKQLRATASGSNILGFYGGLCNTRLFVGRPRD